MRSLLLSVLAAGILVCGAFAGRAYWANAESRAVLAEIAELRALHTAEAQLLAAGVAEPRVAAALRRALWDPAEKAAFLSWARTAKFEAPVDPAATLKPVTITPLSDLAATPATYVPLSDWDRQRSDASRRAEQADYRAQYLAKLDLRQKRGQMFCTLLPAAVYNTWKLAVLMAMLDKPTYRMIHPERPVTVLDTYRATPVTYRSSPSSYHELRQLAQYARARVLWTIAPPVVRNGATVAWCYAAWAKTLTENPSVFSGLGGFR